MELTHDANLESGNTAATADGTGDLTSPPDDESAGLADYEQRQSDGARLSAERDDAALRERPAAKAAGAIAVAHTDQALTFTNLSARLGDSPGPDGDERRAQDGQDRTREDETTDDATVADGRGGNSGDGRGGDRGGEQSDAGGDDERGEEELRRAYGRFATDIAHKRQAAEALGEPITVRLTDSSDPTGEAQYETRFARPADVTDRAQEDARYEALVRARRIDDTSIQADLQQIEAYDDGEGQIVTKVLEGKRLSELTDEDKRHITETEMHGALHTIEQMVQNGVVPNRDYSNTIWVHPETHRLQFSDYEPVEQTDADEEHPILTTGDAFINVMEAFRDPATRGRPEGAAGERIRDLSQHVLRDHFMIRAPHVAYNTETLDPDAIRTVYANTEPSRSTTAHDLHIASHMHDLAISSRADEQTRLNLLGNAQEAYEISIYQSVLDNRGDIHQVLRVDDRGRNLLLTNDHVLQARLALAFWPVSEARVRDEELSDTQRQEVNHNLAVVLGEMMPGGEAPEPSYERQTSHRGFLSEVVAMTALSRVRPDVDTSLAIPTSEARRLYAGPDAAVLFADDGDVALDVDWKMRGNGHSDTVNVGNICYMELSKELVSPFDDDADSWRSVVHIAKLLHDEQLGTHPLEREETALLDRVQQSIWDTIVMKARDFHGVDDLRDRARF